MKSSSSSLLFISLILAYITFGFLTVSCSDYTLIQLADDMHAFDEEGPQINDNGWVVWSAYVDTFYTQIFLYNGIDTIQLTDNAHTDKEPHINNDGWVVWNRWFSGIWLYDGSTTTQIAVSTGSTQIPQINNNGYVVWEVSGEIYLYDGASTTQLTNNDYDDFSPQINDNGDVVWVGCDGADCSYGGDGDHEIFLYDGTSTNQLTNNDYDDTEPQINNDGWVVWWGSNLCSYLYDGTSTTQLTDAGTYPQINNNGWIVWWGLDGSDYWIYLYDGSNTTQIANMPDNPYDLAIADNGYVVWAGVDSPGAVLLYDGTSTTNLTSLLGPEPFGWVNVNTNNNGAVVWANGRDVFLAKPTIAGLCSGTASASTYQASPVYGTSDLGKHLVYFLLPLGAVIGLRFWRRKRQGVTLQQPLLIQFREVPL